MLAEHASSQHAATSYNPYVPEIGQADGSQPVSTHVTHGHVGEPAADPIEHQMDQVSVQSLDIESEAQVARATLERGGGEIYGIHRHVSTFSAYHPPGSANAEV